MDWDRNGARMDGAAPTSAASAKASPPRQPHRKNHPCTTGESRTRAGFSTDQHTARRGNCTSGPELCRSPSYATTSLRVPSPALEDMLFGSAQLANADSRTGQSKIIHHPSTSPRAGPGTEGTEV